MNYLGLNIKRKGRNPAEYQYPFCFLMQICSTRCSMPLLLGLQLSWEDLLNRGHYSFPSPEKVFENLSNSSAFQEYTPYLVTY